MRQLLKSALLSTLCVAVVASIVPARADFDSARHSFNQFSDELQISVTLALIATGDFDGLIDFGFTRRLYNSVRSFERREGLRPDGVLEQQEMRRLKDIADAFYTKLGNQYYAHPVTGAKLLVPRQMFDREERTSEGLVFIREDHNLSLSFVSFPSIQKSFNALYATLTADTAERDVIYKRKLDSYFVATGSFKGRKFYTWMSKTGSSTTGFTVSWSNAWDGTGRRISSLLANSFVAKAD
jgi:serine protease Do